MSENLVREITKWAVILVPLILFIILLYISGRKKKEIFLYYIEENQVKKIRSLKVKKGIHLIVIGGTENNVSTRCLSIVVLFGIDPIKLYRMLPNSDRGISTNTLKKYPTVLFFIKNPTADANAQLEKVLKTKGYKITIGKIEQ